MTLSPLDISQQIVAQAKFLGASLAGIADAKLLKQSPSHFIYPRMEHNFAVGSRELAEGIELGQIAWPANAKAVVVVAAEHKKDEPELDWWDGQTGTPGNRILIRINNKLSDWLEKRFKIKTHKLPYHVEKGGIFLKDAAVMAGLGCIGKNNLLVTPEFGPRIRLRAMILEAEVQPTGPNQFDPCDGCKEPCRKACPQKAYGDIVFSSIEMGMLTLPGRNGCFSRATCNIQMEKDIDDAEILQTETADEPSKRVKYCRRCEFACIAGKPRKNKD
ncbi:MAG: epoxyqueuosine reductase [Desulfobacterales bacterium]|jgi:epoxyqueuosine reductase